MKTLTYLAAPYSGTQEQIEARMAKFYEVDAILMQRGHFTVSPLFKHVILPYGNIPGDWSYWKDYSRVMLSKCSEMIIIAMDGWSTSEGVLGEMSICREFGIPFKIFDLETGEIS